MALVYKITNEVTNKAYVGYTNLTLECRFDQHLKAAEKYEGSSRKLYNSIQKHGTDCWTAEALYDGLTVEQAKELEIKSIAEFDTYYNGYNSTLGGDGNNGIVMSDESNRKRSEALKGIAKDYDRMLGKMHTEETKQKIAQAHTGMKKPWVKWTKEQVEKRAMTRRALTKEQHDDILRLRAEGLTIRETAEQVGLSTDMVKKWAKMEWAL